MGSATYSGMKKEKKRKWQEKKRTSYDSCDIENKVSHRTRKNTPK